jgi:hypothetical protein
MTRAMAMLILMSLVGGSAGGQDEKADATLTLSQGHAAVGAGFSWGKATLSYHGKTYPIQVQGLAVSEVGMNRAEAAGSVYNLRNLGEFSGNYTASGAGATVGGGPVVTAMKNQHGVVIEMRSTTQGASLKLAAEGVKLRATE